MSHEDPTHRFSNRVDDYVRYRPSYPQEAIQYLGSRGLLEGSAVADVGSGTGILSELLLDHVGRLYAIEPNDEMRSAAEFHLRPRPNYVSVKGRAEATTLPDASVDAVVAAQAFHWFDRKPALEEFRRILREPRWMALLWNSRLKDKPFLEAYERLLHTYGTDYGKVNHQRAAEEDLVTLFVCEFEKREFDNHQRLDLAGLKGRIFSSSYTPTPEDPEYQAMARGIEAVFERHNEDGWVIIRYKTQIYSGQI